MTCVTPPPANLPARSTASLSSVRTLLLWLVLASLIPAVIGAGILFLNMYDDGRAQLEKDTIQTARAMVQVVDGQLSKVQTVALALATSDALAKHDLAAFHRLADRILQAESIGTNVVLSDASGQQILNTLRPFGAPLPLLGNSAQIGRVFATGQPIISDLFVSTLTGRYLSTVSVPVLANGKVAYALSIALIPQHLNEILLRQQLPNDWVAGVFDSSGTAAARTRAAKRFVGEKGNPALVARMLAAPEGTLEVTTLEGIPTLTVYSRSPLSHWSVAIGIPRQSLEAPLMRSMALFGFGIALLFGAGIGLAWFMSGRIARSVLALTGTALALEAGRAPLAARVYFREADDVAQAMARTARLLAQRSAEQKQVEQKLELLNEGLEAKVEERSSKVRDLYDNAPCGYHSIAPDGTILQVNQTELDMLGYARDEFEGRRISEFMTIESRDNFQKIWPEVQHCGLLGATEFDLIRKDGTIFPFLVSANIVRDADGQAISTRSTLLDNRERKAREGQITSLNRLLNEVLEVLPFGVMVIDQKHDIILSNKILGALLDYPPELRQRSPLRFADLIRFNFERGDYPGQRLEEVLGGLIHAMETQQTICFERRQANGVFLEVQGRPISAGWTLVTYTDITARKIAAQALEDKRVAEAANRAKSAFVSTMSHEIRTPLNAIVGLTQLLAQCHLERGQRDYVDKLLLSTQALHGLVDDILDFSKIEAGALRLEQAPFSLNTMLETVAAVVAAGMRGKPIEVLFDITPDVPDALIGDAMRVQQILLNLTSNAIKFTEAGEMAVSVCAVARRAGWVTLEFSVRDTGIGIPAEQLESIFGMFTQADTSTTRLYGGTGLGLAISAGLAALMASQINVDSAPGRGSEFRFCVTLGLADNAAPSSPTPCLIPPGLNILIIDDHPLERAILQRTCGVFGWQATALDSGAPGLDELRRGGADGGDYDIMLLDWRMPGMDGVEMLRQAYAAPDIGLPQVLLMASIFELEQASAASAGLYLDGIMAKPITPSSLLTAVTRTLAGDFNAPLAARKQDQRRLSGRRLLVIEDNAINQQVIEEILTRAGASVVIAGNGMAALAALRPPAARFDAVLMDIQMPLMDGHTATRVMREDLGWVDLPIVALTAHAQPEEREKSRSAGMTGHLVKPIDVDALLDILDQGRWDFAGLPGARAGYPQEVSAPTIGIPGVDVGAALIAFGGDQEKYLQLLRQFVASHASEADEARRLFAAADAKGAASLIHGLRGIASLLHANDIAGLSAAIAHALRDGDAEEDVLPWFDQLQVAMEILGESIAQVDATKKPALPDEYCNDTALPG